jgi:DNA-binding transcriptional LysR family regulator
MLLTLRQIEVFRALMRCRTVVGAARELGIAQPTVTKTIRRIEDVCALALFDRHGGRLVPTAEAHRLQGEVALAFEQLEGALARALRLAQADGGSLRLGASPSVGRVLVPQAAADLLKEHPSLSLHVDILSVSQVMDYLLSGQGECAVTLFSILHAGVRSVPVARAAVMAVAPPDWFAAGTGPIAPAALAGRPIIVFEPQSVHGVAVDTVLRAGKITPQRTHVVRFAETAIGLAEAGIGIAIVDAFSALAADRTKVSVRRLDHPPLYEVYLHRQIERARSRLIQRFETALRLQAEILGAGV